MGCAYIQTHENSLVHGLFVSTLFCSVHFIGTVEPVYNGHLGTRYIWPLYTGGCYRENLYKVVSNILVAMAVINE